MNNIQKLHNISQLLMSANSAIQLAESVTPDVLRESMEQLFDKLDISDLEDLDNDGDEQAGSLLLLINGAKSAFLSGNTSAIRIDTCHFDNDANGNNHTTVRFAFTDGTNIASLSVVIVQTRDDNQWITELSYLDDVHQFLLNGVEVNKDLSEVLENALESVAVEIIDENYCFTNYETGQTIEAARALIAKYQPLLDVVEHLPGGDDLAG